MLPTQDASASRELLRFYGVFAASQFLLDSSIWSFYLTQQCQLSLPSAVAVHTSITAASGLFDLPTGSWADRFGRRRMILLGFLSRAVSAALMAFAPSLPVLVLAALLAGFGWAQLSGATEAFLHDNVKAVGLEHSFPRYMSNAVIVSYISRTAAFALSGFLFVACPWLPYAMLAAVLGLGAAIAFSIPERAFERQEFSNDLEHIRGATKIFLSTPALLRFALVSLVIGVVSEQLWFSIQPLLSSVQMSVKTIGLAYAAASAGSAIGAHFAKRLLARQRQELAMAGAVSFLGCGALVFSLARPEEVYFGIAQAVTCIGFGASWASTSSILNASLPSSHRAACLSLCSSIGTALTGLVGMGLGFALERFGVVAVPAVVALAAVILAPAASFSVRALKRA